MVVETSNGDRLERVANALLARGYSVGLPPDYRITRNVAAIVLQRSPKTLANWRSDGYPLKQHVVGNRVYYDLADVLAILDVDVLDPAA